MKEEDETEIRKEIQTMILMAFKNIKQIQIQIQILMPTHSLDHKCAGTHTQNICATTYMYAHARTRTYLTSKCSKHSVRSDFV